MRLDKYLTQSSLGTRKRVHEILTAGEITVNGTVTRDATMQILPGQAQVRYGKQEVIYRGREYFMFYKPKGCISARSDGKHRTVMDYFTELDMGGIFLVGRLDKDTEGILLLTNDGELDHKLMNPDHHVEKKYYFEAKGSLSADAIKHIENGVQIWRDTPVTKPAKMQHIENYQEIDENGAIEQRVRGYLLIREGQKHQVRRMVRSQGCMVQKLKRVAIGALELDETLEPGEYRRLTREETAIILDSSFSDIE